jgi:hypothetical protein
MAVLRDLYGSACAILKRKLGACPKCMASSIAGGGLSWFALAILYAMWPNRWALTFGLVVAAAFTVLTIAHVVVYMFRAAPILRRLPVNGRSEPGQRTRREFAFAVARSGLSFAAAAVLSLAFLPKRVEAGNAKSYALYCLGDGCSTTGGGGITIGCVNQGLVYGHSVSVPCGSTAPAAKLSCSTRGCTVTLELIGGGTCGAPTATILSGFKCTAL